MKLIPVSLVLVFMIKMIVAKIDEDSSESHDLQGGEVNTNTSLTSLRDMTVTSKARKFVVSLETPIKTSFSLPKRGGQRRDRVSKFKVQHNVPRENTSYVSTMRPHLMEARRFTGKPHAIDNVEKLIERSNFRKRRIQSKFNELKAEEKRKFSEHNKYNRKDSEHFESRFKNFKDIDMSNENDSNDLKETKKPLRRRFMKTAASDKVKTIASPPFINVNSQRNYKIKDLLKNQRHSPRNERKMVPVLALQRGNGVLTGGKNDMTQSTNVEESSTKKNDISPEENADQNEFIFVKEDKRKSSTTASPEDEDIVTSDPLIE